MKVIRLIYSYYIFVDRQLFKLGDLGNGLKLLESLRSGNFTKMKIDDFSVESDSEGKILIRYDNLVINYQFTTNDLLKALETVFTNEEVLK